MFREGTDPSVEFEVDEDLDCIGRLLKYYSTQFNLQRFVLARDIGDTVEACDYEQFAKKIIPLLRHFVDDGEVIVRQAFVENLYRIFQYVEKHAKATEVYQFLTSLFTPFAIKLCQDERQEVGQPAVELLANLASHYKSKKELAKHLILPILRILEIKEREKRDGIIERVCHIIDKTAPKVGSSLTLKHFFPHVENFASDHSINVRKYLAEHLGGLCEVLSPSEVEEHILPVFLKLSRDEIWTVRKSSLRSLVTLSKNVTDIVRSKHIEGIFEMFRKDVSRWVKLECYKQIGPLMATFEPGTVSDSLTNMFVGMVFQEEVGFDASIAQDLLKYTSFNFPGVAQALGEKRWFQIEKAHTRLVKSNVWVIRRTMACHLHIIAQTLGRKVSDKHLIPALESILDDLDEIRIEAFAHIADFLKCCSESKATKIIKSLNNFFPRKTDNWRIKYQIARQAVELSKLIFYKRKTKLQNERKEFLKLFLSFLTDPYCVIRKEVTSQIGDLVLHYIEEGHTECVDYLVTTLREFVTKKWNYRQLFAQAAKSILITMTKTKFSERKSSTAANSDSSSPEKEGNGDDDSVGKNEETEGEEDDDKKGGEEDNSEGEEVKKRIVTEEEIEIEEKSEKSGEGEEKGEGGDDDEDDDENPLKISLRDVFEDHFFPGLRDMKDDKVSNNRILLIDTLSYAYGMSDQFSLEDDEMKKLRDYVVQLDERRDLDEMDDSDDDTDDEDEADDTEDTDTASLVGVGSEDTLTYTNSVSEF